MNSWIDFVIILIVLMNLRLMASSRIALCIQITAVQGIIVGFLPLLVKAPDIFFGTIIFASASILLKGLVFPLLLFRAQREANVRRDVEPIGGYTFSVVLYILSLVISCWLNKRLPLPGALFSPWIVPVSFSTILTGFFIIISRAKALTQVLGYLVLENGIYLFGIALFIEQPLLVEFAILLDIFVAVFVMGITIFHISREFDHIDTQYLSQLKDSIIIKQEQAE